MAQRKNKSQWLALFEEQKQSGLSVAQFCKKKQLSETYFYLKRKKLQSQDNQGSTFIAMRPESVTPEPAMTLQFGQCQLQLDTGTSSQWVAALMKSLS